MQFVGDGFGEGLEALVDRALNRGALPGWVGGDHAAFVKELQHPPDGRAGRPESARMSASWTGASVPTQASRIRRVLAPLLREALFQPRARACCLRSLTKASAAGVRAGS